ncbi:MAG TPA: Ig-like domain-containing protein [Anaerolineaceae bacterium]|nr:Ig-like domain-containing protein [Anaerolineaceae bacterium]
MKVKHILIAALVLCLAVPPAFLGSLAAVVNAASQNTPPVAYDQSVTAIAGFRNYITLAGYDADGDPLTYLILDAPAHGDIVEQEGPELAYRPDAGYAGPDSFTFVVQDGISDSNVATVSITVRTNADPVAYDQSVTAIAGFRNYITLAGYDADGDPLTYLILDAPAHGDIVEQEGPELAYRPDAGYAGPDSFTFVVQDGISESNVATVSITVRTNADPVAYPQTVEAVSGVPLPITLSGSDADGDPLTFLVVTQPRFGALTGSGADQVYTSYDGFVGVDFFEFVVQDGIGESAVARVSINVISANRPPVADPQNLNATSGVPLAITLTGSDPDGDALTFIVTDQPDHGTLTGTAPELIYTSASGYIGPDSFQFVVSDGVLTSTPATVTLTVTSSGPVTVFFDDFETEKGWVRNPNGTDTATTGKWERANPEYTWWMGPKQLGTTVSGSNDLVTGPRAGREPGSYDVDNGVTSIKSPSIVLPANSSLTLSFSYYLAHASNSSSADYLRVKVVGASTATVLQVLGTNKDKDAYWTVRTVDLSAFAGQTVYILIEAADNSQASLVEAAVDDLMIVATPQVFASGNTNTTK